ncbi:uncharacterized protein EI90DRAFT_3136225 [Cantharellus anzutake]|uniref:uncharacterized protein n=1 Tax=Cantharellus anzutake TaxID=1750568 RepID=UPI001906AF81|nr:uncharacterized protein EI90DRAFT_3136225 [Cantharellus anzutake]KAF8314160.1 hypothetical protein EI90DRAFT_3136225 [Cantharellus anzutake]
MSPPITSSESAEDDPWSSEVAEVMEVTEAGLKVRGILAMVFMRSPMQWTKAEVESKSEVGTMMESWSEGTSSVQVQEEGQREEERGKEWRRGKVSGLKSPSILSTTILFTIQSANPPYPFLVPIHFPASYSALLGPTPRFPVKDIVWDLSVPLGIIRHLSVLSYCHSDFD